MEIIPAIDIRGGRCVRLVQGDYARETVFSDDPVEMARRWADEGARRLHVVDLDGAREGRPVNREAVRAVIEAVTIPVQVGGGVRDLAAVGELLEMGVDRAILGTAAVREPDLMREACGRYGERIVVSVDARDGLVAVEGWRETERVSAQELMLNLAVAGVRRFVYTDIARDGTLTEPSFAAYESAVALLRRFPQQVPGAAARAPGEEWPESQSRPAAIIASGGVASVEHLRRLAAIGMEGAIVGRALYDGRVELRKALEAVARRP